MKKMILLFLLFQLRSHAQDTLILQFCEKNIGVKFSKDGPVPLSQKQKCYYFVYYALLDVYGLDLDVIGYTNKKVRTKKPQPGDIVTFDMAAVAIGETDIPRKIHHIGIVKEIRGSIVYYYDQNLISKGRGDPGSGVRLGYFNMERSDMKKIYFLSMKKIRRKYLDN